MGKNNNAYQMSAWTTGAGIAIATNCDFGGVWVGSAATTVTLKIGTTDFLVASGANTVIANMGCNAIAVSGALNGTSSGGSFAVIYRRK